MENREYTKEKLTSMGFFVLPSSANFIFERHPEISGEELYLKLKERGILIRHFKKEKIKDFNRITIGTKDMMDAFLSQVSEILKEK